MNYDLYTSLLKMHDVFRPSDAGVSPSVDATAQELAVLREKHGLTQISGEGTSFDKAVRVMDWLTAHVCHDGNCNPQGKRCAMTAIEYAFDQPERGVNCAWLATTLTECLLSIGIMARTIYIMPFAPYDFDNHVVTHVWYFEKKQWVMLDPTMNCYALDKEGNLLDIFALRALLADQQEIVFNESLRYNGQPYNHEEHRDYLAKDLFWFKLSEVSRFDDNTGRELTIAPEGFDPHKRDILNTKYRMRVQGEAPWLRSWLEEIEKNQPIYCSIEDARKAP